MADELLNTFVINLIHIYFETFGELIKMTCDGIDKSRNVKLIIKSFSIIVQYLIDTEYWDEIFSFFNTFLFNNLGKRLTKSYNGLYFWKIVTDRKRCSYFSIIYIPWSLPLVLRSNWDLTGSFSQCKEHLYRLTFFRKCLEIGFKWQ